jgi:hypothetical protein
MALAANKETMLMAAVVVAFLTMARQITLVLRIPEAARAVQTYMETLVVVSHLPELLDGLEDLVAVPELALLPLEMDLAADRRTKEAQAGVQAVA